LSRTERLVTGAGPGDPRGPLRHGIGFGLPTLHQDFHLRCHNDRTATARMSTCVTPGSLGHPGARPSRLRAPIPNSDSRSSMALAGMGIGNPSETPSPCARTAIGPVASAHTTPLGRITARGRTRTERCRARAALTPSHRVEGRGRRAPPKRFCHSSCQTSWQISRSVTRARAVGRWPEGVHQTSTCRRVRPDMRGTPARRSEAARRRSARGRRRGTIPSSGVPACTEPSRSGDAGGKVSSERGHEAARIADHVPGAGRRIPPACEAPALSRTARGVAADTSAGVGVAPASPTIGRRAAGGLRRYVDRVDVGLRGLRRRARTWIPRNIAGPEGHACRRTPRRRSRLLYSPSSASPWFTATGPTGSRSASAMQPAPRLSAPSASADSLPVSPAPSPTSATPSPAGAAQLASTTRYAPNG